MKITRNFGCGDYTFELTDQELLAAYLEKQHRYDVDAVKDKLKYYEENSNEFYEAYGVSYFQLVDKAEDIAFEMRRILDRDSDPYFALIEAIEWAVRNFSY